MSYKTTIFNVNKRTKVGRPAETLENKVMKNSQCTKDQFYKKALQRKRMDMIDHRGSIANCHQEDDLAKDAGTGS